MNLPRAARPASLLSLIVGLGVICATTLPARQAPAPAAPREAQEARPPQQPVFRSGVNLVRVDVSVTGRRGEPVGDLTLDDFEVLEDGVPQPIETIQFERLDGQPEPGSTLSLDIRSREHAEAEAARDDVRIFVIFLDDYHLERRPWITLPLRDALTHFVNRLGPTDLVAIMEPLTPLDALEFTRDRRALLSTINAFEGRMGEIFPVKSVLEEAQLTQRNIGEIRMQVTMSAMTALASYLGGLREGRKSILFVTEGPPVGPLRSDQRSYVDDVVKAAGRGNVTINVLDPRRLGEAPFGGTFVQSVLTLETGGRLIGNTNNHKGGLDKVIEDASAYYLLGYVPARTFSDGKFHRIEVKVRRSGMRVQARSGYWAPDENALTEAAARSAAPEVPGLADSLAALAGSKTGRPVDAWVGVARRDDGRTRLTVTWDRAVTPGAAPPAAARLVVEPLEREDGPALAPAETIGRVGAPGDHAEAANFDLAPGTLALRLTAYGADGNVVDRWTQPVELPAFGAAPVALATPRFLVAHSPFEYRALGNTPDPAPEASRRFRSTDRVLVDLAAYASAGANPTVTAELVGSQGAVLVNLPMPALDAGRARIEIPVRSLAQGTYVLRVRAAVGDDVVERLEAFRVVP